MLTRVLFVIFLASLFSAAWGQDFGLDIGCCSEPLTQGATVDGNGGGVQDYYNSTLNPITELEFEIFVGTGKVTGDTTLQDVENGYQCKAFEYFGTCNVTYDNGSGDLFLDFGGVLPSNLDGDEGFGSTDPETHASEQEVYTPEGLPTLVSTACLSGGNQDNTNLDGINCTIRGHFEVSFNNFIDGGFNGATEGTNDNGGWAPGSTANIVEVNGQPVPEPSSMTVFGALLLAGSWARRRARRRA